MKKIIIIGGGSSGLIATSYLAGAYPDFAVVLSPTNVSLELLETNSFKEEPVSLLTLISKEFEDMSRLIEEFSLSMRSEMLNTNLLMEKSKRLLFPKVLPFNKQQYVNSRWRPRSSIHVKKSR
jgi:thioredoxin reductase